MIGDGGNQLLGPNEVDNKNQDEGGVKETSAPIIGLAGEKKMMKPGHWYLLLTKFAGGRNGYVQM